MEADPDQILAFRLARSGLAGRRDCSLAEAAACPASDFAPNAALLALAARSEGVTREGYEAAVRDGRDLLVAHIVRGAIHALAPADLALYGRALISDDDDELAAQLGQQVKSLAREKGFAPTGALAEVAEATREALAGGRALGKSELHEEWRGRVSADLMPWCRGCESHHVAPMLWRYATVEAGVRLDSQRRYTLTEPGRSPDATDALRRFLALYGPSTPGVFADWAGIAKPHAKRLWTQVEPELAEAGDGWLLADDIGELESPRSAEGIRLLPPGDPYLQKPNRALLAPDAALRKRLFRPVASPGAVLKDGRLAGLWRARAKGKKAELEVEKIGRLAKGELDEEAQRVAQLRGASEATLVLG